MRREVAARRLICWRLCGSSGCTTGGSTARCWRSPWPPTTCGGRVPPREQGRAGGPPRTTTAAAATARSSPPPLPLPPRPRPHPPLQSRRPAETRPPPSPKPPPTEHPPAPTHSSILFPQSSSQTRYDLSSSFPSSRSLNRRIGHFPLCHAYSTTFQGIRRKQKWLFCLFKFAQKYLEDSLSCFFCCSSCPPWLGFPNLLVTFTLTQTDVYYRKEKKNHNNLLIRAKVAGEAKVNLAFSGLHFPLFASG